MAFIGKFTWQIDLVERWVELMILVWCDEIEEILADGIVDGMFFQEEEIGFVFFGLVGHHFTKLTEMFTIFVVQTWVYIFESLGEVKVVDVDFWLEFYKILLAEGMGGFEEISSVNIVGHLYFEVRL